MMNSSPHSCIVPGSFEGTMSGRLYSMTLAVSESQFSPSQYQAASATFSCLSQVSASTVPVM
jgi:hypothetical protein